MLQHHQWQYLHLAVNLEELMDRRQSLVAGYCQGAVVILSPVIKLVLVPACSTLPDGP